MNKRFEELDPVERQARRDMYAVRAVLLLGGWAVALSVVIVAVMFW